MRIGKDEWEKTQEEKELQEFAGSLAEAAEAVRRRVGEQEWQRVRRFRQVGLGIGAVGPVAVGLTLLTLLCSFGRSWLSRAGPAVVSDWEPPLGGGLALLGVGLGVGMALLAAGLLVVRSAERRLRRAAGSDEAADAALMYLSLGSEIWEKTAGQVAQAAGEAAGPTRVAARLAPQVVQRDEWEDRHWLRVEVSGAHLIWWLSFLAAVVYGLSPLWLLLGAPPSPGELDAMLKWAPPEWLMSGVFAIAAAGALLKLMVPLVWSGAWKASGRNPETRPQLKRYYRFWAKGLLPAVLALAPAVAYWGVHVLLFA